MTVWVGSWQMQCCGKPFRVGSRVSWTLGGADPDWVETMLGADTQETVDAVEEHHGGVPEDTVPTRGTVIRISAVHCRCAPRPGSDSRTSCQVPGSGALTVDRPHVYGLTRPGHLPHMAHNVQMTYLEAAIAVLRASDRPLTCGEIMERISRDELVRISGKTPKATLGAALYRSHGKHPLLRRQAQSGPRRMKEGRSAGT
jgi:hypothetical protein